jgi:hypothetical protein
VVSYTIKAAAFAYGQTITSGTGRGILVAVKRRPMFFVEAANEAVVAAQDNTRFYISPLP